MDYKQKLELTWIGKEDEPKLEPRILLWSKDKSYGDENTGNMLIHGDNLLALKALEQEYSGRIKCIYIDPPYNTGSAFEYYEDNLEHSTWLNMMKPRLERLHSLLSEDGVLWISIDDIECHYLKVLCDEIFGRKNFLSNIAYERSGAAGIGQGGNFLLNTHETILVYAKDKSKINMSGAKLYTQLDKEVMKRYKYILRDQGKKILVSEFNAAGNGELVKLYKHVDYIIESISLKNYDSRVEEIKDIYFKDYSLIFRTTNPQKENSFQQKIINIIDKELYSIEYIPSRGKNKDVQTTLHYFNKELFAWLSASAEKSDGAVVKTSNLTGFWKHEDIPKADLANEGKVDFRRGKKPENLIKRILDISTSKGDLVLDSFLGSGTTAAVAHKMKRRWIGIELGDHCDTHCKPRLERVVDGEQGGISKAVGWQGGGGFKFYELAPSLLKQDTYGNWVIDKDHYNAEMLAAAVAKLNGYRYEPHETVFWKQGKSHENSYIFITTQYITAKYLDMLSADMQYGENLLICCPAYDTGLNNRYDNIIIKKIPQAVLDKCEFGVNDYNINLKGVNSGEEEDEADE